MTATASSQPRISVVVPAYNRRSFLKRCLESIEATGYPNLEVLLIDDGSSDGSWELIQQLAQARDGWVHALHHPEHQNRGISASRNLGIAKATGSYLAFLDSDDEYLPNRFDHCVPMLAAQPALFAVYEPVHIEGPGESDGRLHPSAENIQRCESHPLEWLQSPSWWASCAVTVRREFLSTYGSFRPDLAVAEDTELWMRIVATGAIRCGQRQHPVATVHRHGEGHSWDRYTIETSTRFYRKALLTALNSIQRQPHLYDPHSLAAFRARYRQTLEQDIAILGERKRYRAVARLLLEAAGHQPKAIWNKRLVGNLLNWRRWR